MKVVLFLDIDGVLNSSETIKYWAQLAQSNQVHPLTGDFVDNIKDCLDHLCIDRLNKILDRTKADVVISSFWRMWQTLSQLQSSLNRFGFRHTLLDVTPINNDFRGQQIQCWLDHNPGYDRIIILDDNSVDVMDKYLIKTDNFNGGLQDIHVDQILSHKY